MSGSACRPALPCRLLHPLPCCCSQGASCDLQVPWTCLPNYTLGCQEVRSALLTADSGRSPLALAAAGGHREAVAALLMHGAQVDMPTLRHAGQSFRIMQQALAGWLAGRQAGLALGDGYVNRRSCARCV